jgi:hypothetical protein
LVALSTFSGNPEKVPPEARTVTSIERLYVKDSAVANPQSAKLTVTEGNALAVLLRQGACQIVK